jgi:hypothetical protein
MSQTFHKKRKPLPTFLTKLPIVGAIFAVCGVYYSISSSQRREDICIDCNRQKEIAEEVYFGKKSSPIQKGFRL